MTKKQIEVILRKIATENKYEALKDNLFKIIGQIEIKHNFLGDKYWIFGTHSIGVARIKNHSTGVYTYTLKLFRWSNYTEESKELIEEENYLDELAVFIDLMLHKTIK
jgi:hypothetical protein